MTVPERYCIPPPPTCGLAMHQLPYMQTCPTYPDMPHALVLLFALHLRRVSYLNLRAHADDELQDLHLTPCDSDEKAIR